MFLIFRTLRILVAAVGAAGIVVLLAFHAAAEPTQVLEIRVKHVIYYDTFDGKPAGRIARDEIDVPLDIKKTSLNGRLLVNIGGKDLWIPKLVTKTDEAEPKVAVDCQSRPEDYSSTRAFGECN